MVVDGMVWTNLRFLVAEGKSHVSSASVMLWQLAEKIRKPEFRNSKEAQKVEA
jgi:hypothetical protein